MKLILIRHGKTSGNAERRYSGARTDDPLSADGRAALIPIEGVSTDSVCFVSPMLRAVETAQIMLAGYEHTAIEEFREMDFGIFEGKSHEELDGLPAYQEWIDSGGTMRIPGGESRASFTARVMVGLRKACRLAENSGADTMYIVAHGGTVMAVMSSLTGRDFYDFYVGNGEGYEIKVEADDEGNIFAAGTYDSFRGGIRTGSSDR